MPKRNLRIVKADYPLTGICEYCNSVFMSRIEGLETAEKEIAAAFNAHKCKPADSSQNALRIVREATEDK